MQSHYLQRVIRRLFAALPKALLFTQPNWQWLCHYPAVTPTDTLLQKWNTSCWEEYQRWLSKQSLETAADWLLRHQADLHWQNPPRISIVTPVYNTTSEVLYECMLSVRMQTYPYWQWILVDDGSTRPETLALLRSGVCNDPRIQIIFCEKSQGISMATNRALAEAKGDYVVFLDHDDRLALEALSLIAHEIDANPQVDILYSDRDMLSEDGERYLHLFKPDWSPETLLSGNYIFHLLCYKRDLLNRLGGLRPEYDGSQDYDLILRAAETKPTVRHIAKILYHWRQHSASVALNDGAKEYAFQAGICALNDTLRRRGINGDAQEIPDFWRGTYQLNLTPPDKNTLQIISLNVSQCREQYAAFIAHEISRTERPYIAIISDAITPATSDTLLRLSAWLMLDDVGLATGKIINTQGALDSIGMVYNQDASLMYPYRNFPQTEPGYRGVTHITRNISAPYPSCVIIRREVWQQLQGFKPSLKGPHALLDFALRGLNSGWRSVVVPQCVFIQSGVPFVADAFTEDDAHFQQAWAATLQSGDPYYNPNLAQHSSDMGLDI